MCVGAFSSPSSTCCHGHSAGTIRSSAVSKSRATAGSACSFTVTPAVVCGTYTSTAAAPSVSAERPRTSRVMSTS